MGHDAAVTKRKVLGTVEHCVALVNELAGGVETLTAEHKAHVVEAKRRLDANAAWCEENESAIKAQDNVLDAYERLLKSHGTQLQRLAAQQPPVGFWARLKWLCFGGNPYPVEKAIFESALERASGR